jgi:hypothetical protein
MDLDELRQRVERSTRIAFVILVLVVLAYIGKLWFLSDGKLADDPEVWGQFGDYLGGLLNPLIAFLAFYWLTQSVLLQKQELTETKDALRDSADSQSRQAFLAAKTAEINALSALLASHNSDLSQLHNEARFLSEQSGRYVIYTINGRSITQQQALEELDFLRQRIEEAFHERQAVMLKLDSMLDTGFYSAKDS